VSGMGSLGPLDAAFLVCVMALLAVANYDASFWSAFFLTLRWGSLAYGTTLVPLESPHFCPDVSPTSIAYAVFDSLSNKKTYKEFYTEVLFRSVSEVFFHDYVKHISEVNLVLHTMRLIVQCISLACMLGMPDSLSALRHFVLVFLAFVSVGRLHEVMRRCINVYQGRDDVEKAEAKYQKLQTVHGKNEIPDAILSRVAEVEGRTLTVRHRLEVLCIFVSNFCMYLPLLLYGDRIWSPDVSSFAALVQSMFVGTTLVLLGMSEGRLSVYCVCRWMGLEFFLWVCCFWFEMMCSLNKFCFAPGCNTFKPRGKMLRDKESASFLCPGGRLYCSKECAKKDRAERERNKPPSLGKKSRKPRDVAGDAPAASPDPSSMSVKELKALIARAGMSSAGVVEKDELRRLARDAAAVLEGGGT